MKNPPQGAAPGQLTRWTGNLPLASIPGGIGQEAGAHEHPDAQTE